jgi:hypothetical protein
MPGALVDVRPTIAAGLFPGPFSQDNRFLIVYSKICLEMLLCAPATTRQAVKDEGRALLGDR